MMELFSRRAPFSGTIFYLLILFHRAYIFSMFFLLFIV
ncbi:hypothetical protein SD77_2255 [Bacillus badius]|uniref:Uncharacterized protein n=1 Tax=Bacillus badius TaxID=1455 RepID=A0ABR5AZL1_BACBA|nr:hypothetical protein SD77_2255 [Bacillus badius]